MRIVRTPCRGFQWHCTAMDLGRMPIATTFVKQLVVQEGMKDAACAVEIEEVA